MLVIILFYAFADNYGLQTLTVMAMNNSQIDINSDIDIISDLDINSDTHLSLVELILHRVNLSDMYDHFTITDNPYEICRDVNADDWKIFTETCDDEQLPIPFRFLEFKEGCLCVIDIASEQHQLVAVYFERFLFKALNDSPSNSKLISLGPVKVNVPALGIKLCADALYKPARNFIGPNVLATFIVEIACSESIAHVEDKCRLEWARIPGLRYMLWIKVPKELDWFTYKFYRLPDMILSDRAMTEQEFGQCLLAGSKDRLNIYGPTVNITINTQELLGVNSTPAGMPAMITINLRDVVQKSRESL